MVWLFEVIDQEPFLRHEAFVQRRPYCIDEIETRLGDYYTPSCGRRANIGKNCRWLIYALIYVGLRNGDA